MIRNRWMGRLFVFATLGALSSAGCFVVDDKKDDDEGGAAGEDSGGSGGSSKGGNAGVNSTGGKATGGGKSTGGEAGTGSSTGGVSGSSTGGTGGGTGDAVMKFCNNLVKGDADVTLTVDFSGVRASTITGTCTPVVGMDCLTIAAGSNVSAKLYDGSTLLFDAEIMLVEAGDQVIALAVLGDDGYPALDGGVVTDGSACSSWDYSDFFTAALEAKSFDFKNNSSKSMRALRGLNAERAAGFGELIKLH